MLQTPETHFHRHVRHAHAPRPSRIATGPDRREYRPPAPSQKCTVGKTQIEVGKRYRVGTTWPVQGPDGRHHGHHFEMVAAQNQRGEYMLCFEGEKGRPFGGFPLHSFDFAIPL